MQWLVLPSLPVWLFCWFFFSFVEERSQCTMLRMSDLSIPIPNAMVAQTYKAAVSEMPCMHTKEGQEGAFETYYGYSGCHEIILNLELYFCFHAGMVR